jgi:general secretion pathway protein E
MQEALLPYAYARAHRILLLGDGQKLTLWLCEESDPQATSEVVRLHGQGSSAIGLEHRDTADLIEKIDQIYQAGSSSAAAVVSQVQADVDLNALMQLPAPEDLLASRDDAPIVRMLNAMLTQAAREGASDIHIEPYADHSCVRIRMDGALQTLVQPHRGLHEALISRLKIMADLDIAEKRLPQDGRLSFRVGARLLDVRVSTLPCAQGERAVLRLLDKSGARLRLVDIGMQGPLLKAFVAMVHRPHGLILVTGPTGSGKTTTLYAALSELDVNHYNIMTVEDPVEYELAGIGQTQVNPRIELGFARVLRAILRQDPDVIMIGEIRDPETAQIAIQASLTGHLVLATLHTPDAISAITRLRDMGIESYLIGACLSGVLAQRLVRKICRACLGAGCNQCAQSGFRGRTGVFEWLAIEETVRTLIHQEAAEANVRDAALKVGLIPMRQDGQRLIQEGITHEQELMRVTS